ncbi:MAG: TetR/AcrR family transcriptional regulator [Paludibacteraceae bacterium]|nr:TetR/AcrR family transcriptional regulator [Paludibacteraceae bacterium]MEE0084484.1 TetR/AcrR family transcriptional regulator [Paludibacteraceae bacterium]
MDTKDVLIDVARTLFATKGYANTSMNDIANAANKGRRTLYTYFKNKDEVFYAVIRAETLALRDYLKQLLTNPAKSPMERLTDYIYVRLDAVRDIVIRNGGLTAEFFQNQNLVERVRRRLDFSERNYLRLLLEEGKAAGTMDVPDPAFAALVLQSALKGMELPYIRGEFALEIAKKKNLLLDFLRKGFESK